MPMPRLEAGVAPDVRLLGRRTGSSENLVDDRLRLLASWVVGGDDHRVGEARGNFPHEGPLAAVTIAAAPEDTAQAPCRDRPRLREDVFQRFGRMRVVDQHGERL